MQAFHDRAEVWEALEDDLDEYLGEEWLLDRCEHFAERLIGEDKASQTYSLLRDVVEAELERGPSRADSRRADAGGPSRSPASPDARVRARQKINEIEANRDEVVRAFRQRVDDCQLPAPELDVARWARKHPQHAAALADVAVHLRATYGWPEMQAEELALRGSLPAEALDGISCEIRNGESRRGARIMLDIDPSASPNEILRRVKERRREILGDVRAISQLRADLAVYVAERNDGANTWRDAWYKWIDDPAAQHSVGKSFLEDPVLFEDAGRRAYKLVTGEKMRWRRRGRRRVK